MDKTSSILLSEQKAALLAEESDNTTIWHPVIDYGRDENPYGRNTSRKFEVTGDDEILAKKIFSENDVDGYLVLVDRLGDAADEAVAEKNWNEKHA